jgi:hypothetical protein
VSWLEFIEKVIGHAAWPGAAIAILLILRRHLSGVFVALKSLKLPGGVEVELYDRFKELREQAEAAKLPIPETAAPMDNEDRKFLQMAEDFPQAAIMETWIGLEREIANVSAAYAGPTITAARRPRGLRDGLQVLRQSEALDAATLDVIDRLQRIRNEVVHAKKKAVTPGEALEFRELAMAVMRRLADRASVVS